MGVIFGEPHLSPIDPCFFSSSWNPGVSPQPSILLLYTAYQGGLVAWVNPSERLVKAQDSRMPRKYGGFTWKAAMYSEQKSGRGIEPSPPFFQTSVLAILDDATKLF